MAQHRQPQTRPQADPTWIACDSVAQHQQPQTRPQAAVLRVRAQVLVAVLRPLLQAQVRSLPLLEIHAIPVAHQQPRSHPQLVALRVRRRIQQQLASMQ